MSMTSGAKQGWWQQVALAIMVALSFPMSVKVALAGEIIYAPFGQAGGAATADLYSGDVSVTVSGMGQALANIYSDAFYSRPSSSGPSYYPYWNLAVDTSPINGTGSQEASAMMVGAMPAYAKSGVYSFQVNAGTSPTKLYFGVDDNIFSDNSGAYTIVVEHAPSEVVYAPFDQAAGVATTGSYYGKVQVTVSGVGQSLGEQFNDAFYLLPGDNNAVASPTRAGFWDLGFGTSPIVGDGSQEATNAIVGAVPAYNADNIYTLVLDTGAVSPIPLYFGVDDNILSDNSGAYTIVVTQLGVNTVPEPPSLALVLVSLVNVGFLNVLRTRSRKPGPSET